jgi:hypothetical protein
MNSSLCLQETAVLPQLMFAVLRNVERWTRNVEFAAVDQQIASANSSKRSGGASSMNWSADVELPAALAAAGQPPLSDGLFADTDMEAIVAAAKKLDKIEPTATGSTVEVKLVVADVLETFFTALKKDPSLAPLLNEVWLYLDVRSGKHQKLPRLPDGGFLARTADNVLLVSVVNKRSFGSAAGPGAYNDAVNGVQRDHACTLTLPRERMPYGLGVISDGRTYRLVRTEMSPTVTSVWSRPYDFLDLEDVKEFLTLLAHAVVVAATRRYVHDYDLPKCVLGGQDLQVRAVLASSENSIVFRFTLGADELIGKLVLGDDAAKRFDLEEAVWREHGKLLAASDCFVRRASLPVSSERLWRSVSTIVYADDGATPLRDVRKQLVRDTTARLDELVAVVVRDVAAALKHLHSVELAFVDVHPGQIVVQTDADGTPRAARLVDVETVQPFETSVPTKRRVWCAHNFEPREMAKRPVGETDVESFALTLAWLSRGTESDDKHARLTAMPTVIFNDIRFLDADGAVITKKRLLWGK